MLTCPFHYITGLLCPLCGGQRMVVALLHGRVGEAWALNPVAFVLCTAAVILYALSLYNGYMLKRGRSTLAAGFITWLQSGTAILLLVAILMVWGVVRNVLSIG